MKTLRLLCLAALLSLPASLRAEDVRIAASDLLAGFVTEPLEAYGAENSVEFEIDSIGSLPALDRLRSDEIDLAVIAVPEGEAIPRDEFRIYPFAYDVAVVVVNDTNPIDELSIGRLGGIFGSDEEQNYNSWGDLGLSGWGNRKIKPFAADAEGSISLELFKYSVFKGGVMKPSVVFVNESEVENLLESDGASIAILPRRPESNRLKTLMISGGPDSPAFGPTPDNIHYGDYPVRLSFYIAFKNRDEEKMAPILRVLLGDDVAAKLEENFLVPLPETVRRKLLIDLDF